MSSIVPLFLIFSQCLQLIMARADVGLIQETCRHTMYYDLCVSTLESNATSFNTDTKGLALIMIGVGVTNATATSSYLTSQLHGNASDATLKKVLKECADKYTYAGEALQSSAQDVGMENYDFASINVMAAADYPNACHNAFRRQPRLAYPLEIARREEGLEHICGVIMGIIDLLFST